ncbi:MAG: NAD(P)-dependent oxidoreductase [Bacteroidales bacterium]|nr:NAD(P)-dependent oxidoreductase [Bacteroidales bacterium]
MKTIMVIGATGLLGAYISLHFHKLGYKVIAVSRRKNDNGFFADYGIPYYSIDITDPATFDSLPKEGIDIVAHFASEMPATMEGYDGGKYIDSITKGTYNVLEFMRKNNIPKIIFPQSLFDISYQFGSKIPINADSERRAPEHGDHVMYVIAKNAAVEIINHYYREYGIKRFIFRLSRVYAYHPNPYTFLDGKKIMISDRFLIDKAEKGEPIEIWGECDRILETCSVVDFLQIIQRAAESDLDGGIYNIGSGGSTLEERVKGIVEVFSPKDNPSKISYAPEKRSPQQFVLDISKTKSELGYEPQQKWIDFCRWFKEERATQRFAKIWGKEEDYI